ncbi:PadR family transcriptional regulator [Paenibacillus sp. TRM 82003]|uniref:PadR family transcriptional regulator n=1 Tax=Kineococcus sp. TRM81007 TaxID=2925831 RepID=UPI001F57FE6C|nr:PadR family transcriptional regulator [Kineococcus sp. TRM81007]MCI2237202.1 PadR family transcriptional regulator [Kineococcus sp. TRM81007]MCI3925322.1 PadR family transcriptional regulator [Paenibacillus sp. TRM 82003]
MTTPASNPAWPAQWLRGVLDLAVLAVVARGETYGYRIGTDLAALGLGAVKGGTLYPLLARLEDAGDVVSTWREGESGPGRKWYSATPAGRARLSEEGARWRAFAHLTSDLVHEVPTAGGTR